MRQINIRYFEFFKTSYNSFFLSMYLSILFLWFVRWTPSTPRSSNWGPAQVPTPKGLEPRGQWQPFPPAAACPSPPAAAHDAPHPAANLHAELQPRPGTLKIHSDASVSPGTSFYPSIRLSISLTIYLSLHLSISLSMSIYLSVYTSIIESQGYIFAP